MDENSLFDEGETNEDGIGNDASEDRQIYLRTFVHFVEPNKVLYVKRKKGYSKTTDIAMTWAALGQALTPQMTGVEAQKLFHRLREKYGKERKKVLESQPRSGAGSEATTYISPWFLYKDLDFLGVHIQARKTKSNFSFKSPDPKATSAVSFVRPQSAPTSLPSQSFSAKQRSSGSSSSCTIQGSSLWDADLYSALQPPSTVSDNSWDTIKSASPPVTSPAAASDGASSSGAGASAVLRAMAASIQPAKNVPPSDTVKKRKRESDKVDDDAVRQSSKDMSSLATTLSAALQRVGQPPQSPAQQAVSEGVSSQVQALMGSVTVALSRVPEKDQINCVVEMLAVAQRYQ